MELREPSDGVDLAKLSVQEMKAAGFGMLPRDLGSATEIFAESQLMRDLLGDHIHSYLVDQKRREWNEYLGQVSEWELSRFLKRL